MIATSAAARSAALVVDDGQRVAIGPDAQHRLDEIVAGHGDDPGGAHCELAAELRRAVDAQWRDRIVDLLGTHHLAYDSRPVAGLPAEVSHQDELIAIEQVRLLTCPAGDAQYAFDFPEILKGLGRADNAPPRVAEGGKPSATRSVAVRVVVVFVVNDEVRHTCNDRCADQRRDKADSSGLIRLGCRRSSADRLRN